MLALIRAQSSRSLDHCQANPAFTVCQPASSGGSPHPCGKPMLSCGAPPFLGRTKPRPNCRRSPEKLKTAIGKGKAFRMKQPKRSASVATLVQSNTYLFTFTTSLVSATKTLQSLVRKFSLTKSGLELERRTQHGAFLDVLGRRSALYGYEHRTLEAWVYPLQLLDQFELSFRLEGYPLEFRGSDTATLINVRPEATTITYSQLPLRSPKFSRRSVNPDRNALDVTRASAGRYCLVSARLKLMWPADLWSTSLDENEKFDSISRRANIRGRWATPRSRVSVMP